MNIVDLKKLVAHCVADAKSEIDNVVLQVPWLQRFRLDSKQKLTWRESDASSMPASVEVEGVTPSTASGMPASVEVDGLSPSTASDANSCVRQTMKDDMKEGALLFEKARAIQCKLQRTECRAGSSSLAGWF